MNEPEQAQAIIRIKSRHAADCRPIQTSLCHHDRAELLKIVDSQAQKIDWLTRKKDRVFSVCHSYIRHIREERGSLRQKIAEQAKEIERLKNGK